LGWKVWVKGRLPLRVVVLERGPKGFREERKTNKGRHAKSHTSKERKH